jgi:hypothetical protein
MYIRSLALLTGTLVLSAGAFAQSTVNSRRQDQQDRIANGVDSGQLTAGETKSLEGKEANLNREIRDDRKADGGKLTGQERKQINGQENNVSKNIYNDKHNASTAHYGSGTAGQRRANQQARIANGIRNGSLKPGEASHLENREQGLNQQIRADRQANGGKLNAQQVKQVNQAQNRASQAIYNKKHNGQNGY